MSAKAPQTSLRILSPAILAAVVGVAIAGAAGAQAVPGFTADQARRGAELYSANCAMCHGDALDDGQFAPPLKGAAHAAYWQGKSAADLFSFMATTMPPTQPGGLGAQAYADIMAYLYEKQGVQPGSTELPAEAARLAGVKPTS